jgi:hypothetical protein
MKEILVLRDPIAAGDDIRHHGPIVIEKGGIPEDTIIIAKGSIDILHGDIGERAEVISTNGEITVHDGEICQYARVEAEGDVVVTGGINDDAEIISRSGSVSAEFCTGSALTPNGFLKTSRAA